MSADDSVAPPAPLAKADPETLVLRARPARAIRFRRGVIVSLVALAAGAVAVTSWLALEPHPLHLVGSGEGFQPATKASADTLGALPATYDDVPKLGPPLPGDLGRPILDRQRGFPAIPEPLRATDARHSDGEERERRVQALKAARESGLMVQTATRSGSFASPDVVTLPPGSADTPTATKPVPDADPNGQQAKIEFARAAGRPTDVDPGRLTPAPSPYTLAAGSVISASLITGLNSDLPGMVTAQVTERVFDSATGSILLIPQGARLIGKYDSVIAFGQRRALVIWQRILLPDGSSVAIANAPATDPSGYAGLTDKVDFHTWALLKGVVLSSVLGVGSELQFSGNGDLVTALREAAEQNVSRAGDRLTTRNLDIQPTITVRPGAPVRLLVDRDLVLAPWREG